MKAMFVELPPFQRLRDDYFDLESFRAFQNMLMKDPDAGDIIRGAGGLRKIRFTDERRGKGERGGSRVIYDWHETARQFWLFTVYDKDEADDLTVRQRELPRERLGMELQGRGERS